MAGFLADAGLFHLDTAERVGAMWLSKGHKICVAAPVQGYFRGKPPSSWRCADLRVRRCHELTEMLLADFYHISVYARGLARLLCLGRPLREPKLAWVKK